MEATLLRAEMLVVTAGNSGTDKIGLETHMLSLAMMYLQAFSYLFVFRLTCMGLASASVRAGSA